MTTINDIADNLYTSKGFDHTMTTQLLNDHIAELSSGEVDKDNLTDVQAKELVGYISKKQRSGELGENSLISLSNYMDTLNTYMQGRDDIIMDTIRSGARIKDIMEVTGLSRQRIEQIRAQNRDAAK